MPPIHNLAISWARSDSAVTGIEYKNLADIIEKERITTVFQPITCLRTGMIYAYEALSRINGPSPFSGPETLFKAAFKYGVTARLERLCRKKALLTAHEKEIDLPITINVCPSILKCPNHEPGVTLSLVEELFDVRDKVILELTERFSINDHKLFRDTVDYYRRQGFRIAIDDLGAGFAGLNMLIQIEPYMVKVDRALISDIHNSPKKQMLLESLVGFCRKINARVVAEGVETEDELSMLIDLKIDFGQGYYIGRPAREPETTEIVACYLDRHSYFSCKERSNRIESLVQFQEPVSLTETVTDLETRFRTDQTLTCLPVVNEGVPAGIVHKRKLFFKLGQRYGYDLFCRKSAGSIMEQALMFESGAPIEDVSRRVLTRDENSVYDAVIVVQKGLYAGIVKVHQILERITEQKIDIARQVNPLTGLPGNNSIRDEILRRVNNSQRFALLYLDLDHFKPFNDNFGFDQGDQMIRYLGNLLKDMLSSWDYSSFVGHIGGDDFIAVCKCDYLENLCIGAIERFENEKKKFHDANTIQKGGYESRDRNGNLCEFPLPALSIAVVGVCDNRFDSYENLVSFASKIKKKVKKIPGSSYLIEHYHQVDQ